MVAGSRGKNVMRSDVNGKREEEQTNQKSMHGWMGEKEGRKEGREKKEKSALYRLSRGEKLTGEDMAAAAADPDEFTIAN